MKNKVFKFLFAICLLIPCVFSLTGCLNGGTFVSFETWGGTPISSKHYEYNPTGTTIIPSQFPKPTKAGYKFKDWYADPDFTRIINTSMVATNGSVTYYAQYEVDYSYFADNRLAQWNTFESSPRIFDGESSGSYNVYILFDKRNTSHTFNSITVSPIDSSPFTCSALEVSDSNGKPAVDADARTDVFVPETKTSAAVQYVLKLTVISQGAFRLTFN